MVSRRTVTGALGALGALGVLGGSGGLAWAGLASSAQAAPRREVVVVTSYPDELVSRFEAAFEKAYPQWRLRVLWRSAHDALPTLRKTGAEAADVYWSPSPRNFAVLKQDGLLKPLDIDRTGLPGRLGNTPIDDPDGYYAAFEIAGYGFAVNPGYLQTNGLPAPADWSDLADARYAGHLALPNPGKVGFAPVMADIALQAYGWQPGWALWSAAVANAQLINQGGTFVADEQIGGRRGVGVSIDFFVHGAIAKGAPLRFIYPRHGGVNPSHIGLLAGGRNLPGARDFATFALGTEGQRLLAHPDIRRLPVRPAVYADLPGSYDPFAAAAAGGFDYDGPRGLKRLALIAALFDVALAQRQADLARLWPLARAANHETALKLLGMAPIAEADAERPDWQQAFANRRDDPQAEAQAAALEAQWGAEAEKRLSKIKQLLETP